MIILIIIIIMKIIWTHLRLQSVPLNGRYALLEEAIELGGDSGLFLLPALAPNRLNLQNSSRNPNLHAKRK
jgi:hypothetical protein